MKPNPRWRQLASEPTAPLEALAFDATQVCIHTQTHIQIHVGRNKLYVNAPVRDGADEGNDPSRTYL